MLPVPTPRRVIKAEPVAVAVGLGPPVGVGPPTGVGVGVAVGRGVGVWEGVAVTDAVGVRVGLPGASAIRVPMLAAALEELATQFPVAPLGTGLR